MYSISFLISFTNFFRYAQIKHEILSLENLLNLCWTRLYSSLSKIDERNELLLLKKKSEGKLHYYLKNSIPMFNMNLEPQEAGLEECAAEIV